MKFSTKFAGAVAFTLAVAFSPVAFATQSENAPIASNGNSVNNPGFDASGNALNKVVFPLQGKVPSGLGKVSGASPNNGISFNGGKVMTDADGMKINIIWYGKQWLPAQQNIIKTYLADLSASPRYNINTSYFDLNKVKVTNKITLLHEFTDLASQGVGVTLSDAQIFNIVSLAAGDVTFGSNIKNPNAVTLVLTSVEVKKSGFLTSYCGWHSFNSSIVSSIKYSFVGNPGTSAGCAAQTTSSPNGDIGVDAMLSVITHEIEEAATDPELNAWYDNRGYENADKCAWKFGTTQILGSNGSKYNFSRNGNNYLIQQNWVNASGGYCAMGY